MGGHYPFGNAWERVAVRLVKPSVCLSITFHVDQTKTTNLTFLPKQSTLISSSHCPFLTLLWIFQSFDQASIMVLIPMLKYPKARSYIYIRIYSYQESSKPDLILNFILKVCKLRFSRHTRLRCRKSFFFVFCKDIVFWHLTEMR